ncbi:CDP-diacylglycerol--glycerol-3-phosphate 3-phosphatidyltransferase [Culicoidibacter larvae]|uniref:CDP-diacylglycerol--glycerol-3-phosphate 3-phosphatidyltransferase n=1 Tax=Culicoidibacter larvae TaxID=2579976 RepID=A0A5R8QHA6_9FIRM|nr:CDP-diacylglycerol--glycerol-3-phosphate 3-phosphatidyltransferase [Culicoidibacter larvae]TLG77080.1 CDP-diacylglycerol--glycerol-3-phosphate 3-phosphatidyltransferase [Culicoidibacter larvae]
MFSLPTKITIARIIFIPFVLIFWAVPIVEPILWGISLGQLISAILFVILTITDFVDGYIARKYNMITEFGKFLDPIADKVLVFSAYFLLIQDGSMIYIPALIMLTREFIVASLRMIAASKGTVIAADMFGKLKTVSQFISLFVYLFGIQNISPAMNVVALVLLWISVLLTVLSGVNYVKNSWSVLAEEN